MMAGVEPTDANLPAALRGPDGFVRLVQGVGLRISVIGTRGKSTVAVMAAAALKRRGLAVHTNAPAPATDPSTSGLMGKVFALAGLDREEGSDFTAVMDGIRREWPAGAFVLRNPGLSSAAQRAFHARVALPHYVLLTNVRRDPHGPVAANPIAAARAFARTVTPGATLVSGETDPALKAALRRECERLGVPFIDAPPGRLGGPGTEAVSIVNALLLHRTGAGLQPPEEEQMRRELETRFRWSPSTLPGVQFFDAGPIHDVDSTQIVLNHLQAQRRHPVTFVAYFRSDRPGRTRSYVPFLADLLNAPDTRQVFLCGSGARQVAAGLRRWESQVHVVPDDVAGVPRLVRRLQFECQGGAIVLLANGGPDWPRALVAGLKGANAPSAVPRPMRVQTPAGLAPNRITRPLVAPAPSIPDIGEAFSLARFTRPAPTPAPPSPPPAVAAPATLPVAPTLVAAAPTITATAVAMPRVTVGKPDAMASRT